MSIVALDLDGTLEDSRADMVDAVVWTREHFGLEHLPSEDFRAHVNRGMDHLYRHCFSEHLAASGEGGYDAVKTEYTARYASHIAVKTQLYPGIADALNALAAEHHLALVTNKPEGLSRTLLDALAIGDLFGAIVGGDTFERSKPHKEPLLGAIKSLGGGPAVMVGDSQGDLRCARDAGVPSIWCAWGYADNFGEVSPTAVASSPRDLPRLVREILSEVC